MRSNGWRVFLGLLAWALAAGMAQGQRAPGAPPPNVQYTVTFTKKVNELMTLVEPGDVVLLKSGTSRERSNWAMVIRYNVRPCRDCAKGFATIIPDKGNKFRGTVLQSNAVYLPKSAVTTYIADASKDGVTTRVTYTIDETKIR